MNVWRGLGQFLLGVLLTLFSVYSAEAVKHMAATRAAIAQLQAQLDLFESNLEGFDSLSALYRQVKESSDRSEASDPGAKKGQDGSEYSSFSGAVNTVLRLHGSDEGAKTMVAAIREMKNNKPLLQENISAFESELEALNGGKTVIGDEVAAMLGANVAGLVVRFRSERSAAYHILLTLHRYLRDADDANVQQMVPIAKLYFKHLVGAYLAEIRLRRELDLAEGKGVLRLALTAMK